MDCFLCIFDTHLSLHSQEKRQNLFIKQKKEIADLMLEMDRSPETNFEKEVVTEEEGRFVLSTDNMSALEALLAEVTH